MSNKAGRSVPGTKAVLVSAVIIREIFQEEQFFRQRTSGRVLKAERAPWAKAPGHSIPGNASQDSSEHPRAEAREVRKGRKIRLCEPF